MSYLRVPVSLNPDRKGFTPVARFFKYKSLDALESDVQSRGLPIRFSRDWSSLALPTMVAGRRVGNRMAIHPMEGCDGNPDGTVGELTLRRYQRFGAGGAKLIWGEAAAVVPSGRANPRQLVIGPAQALGLRELVRVCRQAHRESMGDDSDLLIGLQLTHSGRYSVPKPALAVHHPILDRRTVMDKTTGARATAETPLISDDELDDLQNAYVQAALLAFETGFDFVDVKQCHGYLLNELLGSRTRPGKYGGPYENRARFVRETIQAIRRACPDALIATRLNLHDHSPFESEGVPSPHREADGSYTTCWGNRDGDPQTPDFAEPFRLIGDLVEHGLALVNATLGNPYANPHIGRPFEFPAADSYDSPEHPLVGVARHFAATEAIQTAFPDLPIVGTGYSWLRDYAIPAAAANVQERRVTFAGIGRGSLSQPDFARKVLRGEPLNRKQVCQTFSYCTSLMRSKHNELGQFPAGCPPFDKEAYGSLWEQAKAKPSR